MTKHVVRPFLYITTFGVVVIANLSVVNVGVSAYQAILNGVFYGLLHLAGFLTSWIFRQTQSNGRIWITAFFMPLPFVICVYVYNQGATERALAYLLIWSQIVRNFALISVRDFRLAALNALILMVYAAALGKSGYLLDLILFSLFGLLTQISEQIERFKTNIEKGELLTFLAPSLTGGVVLAGLTAILFMIVPWLTQSLHSFGLQIPVVEHDLRDFLHPGRDTKRNEKTLHPTNAKENALNPFHNGSNPVKDSSSMPLTPKPESDTDRHDDSFSLIDPFKERESSDQKEKHPAALQKPSPNTSPLNILGAMIEWLKTFWDDLGSLPLRLILLFPLLVPFGLIGIHRFKRRNKKKLKRTHDAPAIVQIYQKACDLLRQQGLKRGDHQTPAEFLESLPAQWHVLIPEMTLLTDLFSDSCYGKIRHIEPANLLAMQTAFSDLKQKMKILPRLHA